jgi:acetylornithine deacetylase/succinyl-diaminopimelate desuccinylase-like protein
LNIPRPISGYIAGPWIEPVICSKANMNPVEELIEFLRFASVSADRAYKAQVNECAEWLEARLQKMGLSAQTFSTLGNPVVVACNERKQDRRTLLIYGHYDVQPPDPLDLWYSPPFEPVIRDGRIFGRGSTDNKGQLLAHILGIESLLAENGELPLNLIVLIEGEEEIGSPHLDDFLRENKSALQADVVAVSDTGMVAPGIPTFTYGLRGILCMEIRLRGPAADLHSGIFGGSVANPATELSRILGKLHDENGRITVNGFYDEVLPVEDWERHLWSSLPFTEQTWLETTGSPALAGEKGYSFLERVWARPTAEVNGLAAGYQGEGPKTIIPSKAMAKLSFRLVPDQDPSELKSAVSDFLRRECPESVEIEVIPQHEGKPYLVKPDSKFGQAAQEALRRTFDKPIAFIREGGSIPITQTFKEVLGIDTLLLGLALPDAKVHSPNENFLIENLHAGIRLNRELLNQIARLSMIE